MPNDPPPPSRRSAAALLAATLTAPVVARAAPPRRPPNFVVILCDDLGFGDIGPTGGRTIRTPNLDRMAAEGLTLTSYYAPANICSPSRAGLLTGRYPIRTGLGYQVIMAADDRGLPRSEVTIPQALGRDYASALIGKWHLGHRGDAWPPTRRGFDYFFGIPYSHDMAPLSLFESRSPDAPPTSFPVDFPRLQQDFYDHAEAFITANAARPFFLELAFSAPHLPEHPRDPFKGRSRAGSYGAVVEELDALTGRLLAHLERLGLTRDTLVVFTSDNGPWFEGSAGPLRGRKGDAGYDGGMRVPLVARQPGTVPAGRRSDALVSGMDLLPTFCRMAGRPPPAGVRLDGIDVGATLTRGAPSPREELLLFDNEDVVGVRTSRWAFIAADYYRGFRLPTDTAYPQLYDMAADGPGQSYSLASDRPEVLADMRARLARARAEFAPLKSKEIPPVFKALAAQLRPD